MNRALAVIALLAVLGAGWAGWTWWQSSHSDDVTYAQARDLVLMTASDQIRTLNTVDYRKAEDDLTQWQRVTTGNLLSQLTNQHDSDVNSTKSQKTVSTAKVLDAAVSTLDTRAGTATVLVAVEVTISQADGQPSVRKSRVDAVLQRTEDGWKTGTVQVIE
jgi:Mce-associated membrane protein